MDIFEFFWFIVNYTTIYFDDLSLCKVTRHTISAFVKRGKITSFKVLEIFPEFIDVVCELVENVACSATLLEVTYMERFVDLLICCFTSTVNI